jgi:hypothetical protein
MHANQKTFVRDGVSIPLPVRTVDLHVSPDFSGRVLVYLHGLVSERRLTDDEMILTLDGFIELARKFGWTVTPSSGN